MVVRITPLLNNSFLSLALVYVKYTKNDRVLPSSIPPHYPLLSHFDSHFLVFQSSFTHSTHLFRSPLYVSYRFPLIVLVVYVTLFQPFLVFAPMSTIPHFLVFSFLILSFRTIFSQSNSSGSCFPAQSSIQFHTAAPILLTISSYV